MTHAVHPENVEKLVTKHARMWEFRREHPLPGRGELGEISYGPYLLISRERGAGGSQLAQALAERLGWAVFDRQLVDAIAEEARARQLLVESLDEHAKGAIDSLLRQFFAPEQIGPSEYLYHLRQVVLTLGHHGHVIIVGRGADCILPMQFGLRVRLVAPLAERIRRTEASEGISTAAARALVDETDRERAGFIRRVFRRDPCDATNYDLIVNTGTIAPQRAAEIVLKALEVKLGVTPAPLTVEVAR